MSMLHIVNKSALDRNSLETCVNHTVKGATIIMIEDGVYQLVKGQDTKEIGMKNFSPTYSALGDYDINKIYVEKESLEARGLTVDDLQHLVWEDEDEDWAEKDSIKIVSSAEMAEIMDQSEVVLSF